MTKTTVFIIVDAGRSDYVRPDSMPFVHGLAQTSLQSAFNSPPGFAQRTVLFSGRYPDTSGNFSAFKFDPEASPFAWVKRMGPVGNLVKPRKIMFPARKGIDKITKWVSGAYHTDPAWIPPRYLPFFRPCEDMQPLYEPGALGAPSIFDLCRDNGLKFRYLAHPVSGNDADVYTMLTKDLEAKADYNLYVAQFSVTDAKGHTHGPFSEAMQTKFLRDLDKKLEAIHKKLSENYDEWDLFLCGDHGMAPVHTEVNVLKELKKADAEPAKDYVVFVNSTLAVLWYLTDRGREAVEAVLPSVQGTHVVDDDERRALRIPTDKAWGDRMLAAEPGVMFWPDYFHVRDSKIVGMHGYLDKREETLGLGVLASSNGHTPALSVGKRSLVDVFPTLCDLIGVKIPASQEGQSLLGDHAVVHAP